MGERAVVLTLPRRGLYGRKRLWVIVGKFNQTKN